MARCKKCGEFMFFRTDSGLCAACEAERVTGSRLRLRHGRIVSAPEESEETDPAACGLDPELDAEAYPEEYPEEEEYPAEEYPEEEE